MAPIRIGIIGLSSSAKTAWASTAHLPYLLSARGREKYRIVALCNSSEEAARSAIKAFGLPADETRAYGDPESLARDPDVDLVVVSTRVDVHHPTALPSVRAGKHVFVEWPLAGNVAAAEELAEAAAKAAGGKGDQKARAVVGLQGRIAPPVLKLRELVSGGRIGKVVSSQFWAAGGTNHPSRIPKGIKYFLDPAVGGNIYTIGFGHPFDQVQHVLGDFTTFDGRLHLQRPENQILDPSTKEVIETVTSRVPDIVHATGTLAASPTAQQGAPVQLTFRRGAPFPGEPALVWSISGETGEIRVKAQAGTALHVAALAEPITIEVHDFESGAVEEVGWEWPEWQRELPGPSRTTAAVYDELADVLAGVRENDGLATFEEALVRHKQLDRLLDAWLKEQK